MFSEVADPRPVAFLDFMADDPDAAVKGLAGEIPVSYTHLRAHETVLDLVCRLLLEKKKKNTQPYVQS